MTQQGSSRATGNRDYSISQACPSHVRASLVNLDSELDVGLAWVSAFFSWFEDLAHDAGSFSACLNLRVTLPQATSSGSKVSKGCFPAVSWPQAPRALRNPDCPNWSKNLKLAVLTSWNKMRAKNQNLVRVWSINHCKALGNIWHVERVRGPRRSETMLLLTLEMFPTYIEGQPAGYRLPSSS